MINNELKNQIIDRMQIFVESATNDEDKFILATEFLDRLFIANYLSFEDMTELIKNELKFVFDLNSEQIEKILDEYIEKNNCFTDKIFLEQIKQIINMFKPFVDEKMRNHNKNKAIEISNCIIKKNIIKNADTLKKFIKEYICNYYELNDKEIYEVRKELKI